MPKFLIINADDFGYNEEQNKAIVELYSQGLITSTSVLAVAPKALSAVEKARDDNMSVGVHLAINEDGGQHWFSQSGRESLRNKKGELYRNQQDLTFNVKRRDVRAELEAQYDTITAFGVNVDHADNHSGTLYGINGRRFFLDAYDFCAEHSLPYRFPKTPGFLERQIGMKIPKPLMSVFNMLVSLAEKRNVKLLDDLVSNPWSIKNISDYEMLRDYYLTAVDNCIDGVTEMFFHPAYPCENASAEWKKREYELKLLKSGDLLERAKKNGIEVISWSDFKDI